ncbi:hypothetical protein BDP27DRAFT_1372306 [Rhodocollybia butyracea]|uniref:Uncharacterized protein n=1 Tax=Rhodocollybia butyracea TaxID=206335 RepID=A0A9P5P8A5_9AGAR|nr:hypothetical protein BDP27DRAFT_1372306 [Rhodocollybia butyracea]
MATQDPPTDLNQRLLLLEAYANDIHSLNRRYHEDNDEDKTISIIVDKTGHWAITCPERVGFNERDVENAIKDALEYDNNLAVDNNPVEHLLASCMLKKRYQGFTETWTTAASPVVDWL